MRHYVRCPAAVKRDARANCAVRQNLGAPPRLPVSRAARLGGHVLDILVECRLFVRESYEPLRRSLPVDAAWHASQITTSRSRCGTVLHEPASTAVLSFARRFARTDSRGLLPTGGGFGVQAMRLRQVLHAAFQGFGAGPRDVSIGESVDPGRLREERDMEKAWWSGRLPDVLHLPKVARLAMLYR